MSQTTTERTRMRLVANAATFLVRLVKADGTPEVLTGATNAVVTVREHESSDYVLLHASVAAGGITPDLAAGTLTVKTCGADEFPTGTLVGQAAVKLGTTEDSWVFSEYFCIDVLPAVAETCS